MSVPQLPPAIDLQGKTVDPAALLPELQAAGIPAAGISIGGDELRMVDADGAPILPTPEAEAVVDAHVPPPKLVEFAGSRAVDAVLRTTDDQPHEVFRFPTSPQHVYAAEFRMTAVDSVSGVTKRQKAEMTFKRLAASVAQVGSTVVSPAMQDAAASTWTIQPGIVGTDLTISVKGAAGRTIDWLLTGDIGTYAPGGLEG